MKTSDFDYDLPQEFIAQAPAEPRDSCKLMMLGRDGCIQHKIFRDICNYLHAGDLLVLNITKVFPARLFGVKAGTGAKIEVLLLDGNHPTATHECLVRPAKRLHEGDVVEFFDENEKKLATANMCAFDADSTTRKLVFESVCELSLEDVFYKIGNTPLPPYITEYKGDMSKYQTIYAQTPNSAAAPTAGLHFTQELLDMAQAKGVEIAKIDLEVGLDTFRTLKCDNPLDHVMHSETYSVSQEVIDAIAQVKARGGRVIAVGTTSVRSLESAYADCCGHFTNVTPVDHEQTKLYIYPGYEFKVVDAIITNFHVPRSTLVMLVSAFSGRENILHAYEVAKQNNYRFFSFGDAMFLI
ncbi:MAG: tRNA preQ1(34) S-adenosylmethionine ribosyltransferase-isomerase QueA [Coriobacteriales bacterium]|nr:tRNA preQ1(34) S-adenosylmethionine ribosyltransferase-isomerase QueA [Coriobacteriales bacterium]